MRAVNITLMGFGERGGLARGGGRDFEKEELEKVVVEGER